MFSLGICILASLFILIYGIMKKLLVPVLVLLVLVQFVLLRIARQDGPAYPRVLMENDNYVVEILDQNMEDDSVRATKYRIQLSSDEFGVREVVDQSSTWACWPGRGHEDFSDEWCE